MRKRLGDQLRSHVGGAFEIERYRDWVRCENSLCECRFSRLARSHGGNDGELLEQLKNPRFRRTGTKRNMFHRISLQIVSHVVDLHG